MLRCANLFAAFKGNENKKLMETAGLKERLGTVGNQFAVTTILAFLISIPFMLAKEGACRSTRRHTHPNAYVALA